MAKSTAIVHTPPPPQEDKPKLSPIEHFKFRKIDAACAASSMSKDSRYSDITVVLFLKEKTSVSSGYYSGTNTSSTYKDFERLSIHTVYDSLEEYYTTTIKLLKRSSFSSFDNEENVPDRICLNAKELREEIKKAFLFFGISPKAAYKQFRKLFKQKLVIDYDDDNRASVARTENCEELFERLNKKPDYSGYAGGMHGYCGD